jgi:hypothetical protein
LFVTAIFKFPHELFTATRQTEKSKIKNLSPADQEFRRDNHWDEKAGGGIKQPDTGLTADVGQMSEIPGDKVIYFMKRSQSDVQRVS